MTYDCYFVLCDEKWKRCRWEKVQFLRLYIWWVFCTPLWNKFMRFLKSLQLLICFYILQNVPTFWVLRLYVILPLFLDSCNFADLHIQSMKTMKSLYLVLTGLKHLFGCTMMPCHQPYGKYLLPELLPADNGRWVYEHHKVLFTSQLKLSVSKALMLMII